MDILSIAIAKKLSQGAVAELLAASPDTVKALQNLVAALNDDPSYAESITTEIGEMKGDVETLGTEVESLTEQINDLAEKVGAAEDGEDGGYYMPEVDGESGLLSWTPSKSGMPAVASVNVRGYDGEDGDDGFSPTIMVEKIDGGTRLIITDINGTKAVDIMDGADGEGGESAEAISPTVEFVEIDGGHRLTVTDANGTKSIDIMDGVDGKDGEAPVKGVDYMTDEDIAQITQEVAANLNIKDLVQEEDEVIFNGGGA